MTAAATVMVTAIPGTATNLMAKVPRNKNINNIAPILKTRQKVGSPLCYYNIEFNKSV